ncbi:rod shape-determining protein RodA [Salirhabdus salicampi]|uniref:rod shape-determining protein RodA n=1 Tax=Salirhabdus salicampi TaxID=476102 RepID=UPI0020C29565|nr:rod shape-determining protein RodA [Salirhabdus salicampi]MCP8617702.1 rod shape-determining protein RodA [Salirhabdus salicampi]
MGNFQQTVKNIFNRLDYIMLLCLLMLFAISLVAIYSAAGQYSADPSYYVIRQIIWYGIGFMILFSLLFVDFDIFRTLAYPLYAFGSLLLLLVHFFGVMRNGSQRWLSIGGLEIQPSEFMKVFLIIAVALAIHRYGQKQAPGSFSYDMQVLLRIAAFGLVPFWLILQQPDLGTALVVVAILAVITLVSGVSYKVISVLAGLGVSLVLLLIWLHNNANDIFRKIIKDHQMSRIYGWLQPDDYASSFGYQLKQAILGIGAGRLTGSGFMNGTQSQSGRVPEIHTDFIFTVVGEEFGFLGASILILIFFLLIYRMIAIGLNCSNPFGAYIVCGAVALIASQVFQNIAMTIGLMPITGLALPFISYGGSSLLTNMIAVGLVMNIKVNTRSFMFGSKKQEL